MTNNSTAVIDKRDNEQYLVQRLADGKCWLLDNLRLNPGSISLSTLKGNTNASDNVLNYFKNGGGTTPYTSKSVSSTWPITDSYNQPYVNIEYRNNVADATYGSASGKMGVFYNYCAATAGSYCYSNGNNSGNASYDICPSGWRIPTSGKDTGDYYALYNAYSSNRIAFLNALSLPLSGVFSRIDGGLAKNGEVGYLWSSTYGDANAMWHLRVSTSTFQSISANMVGFPVRCILK